MKKILIILVAMASLLYAKEKELELGQSINLDIDGKYKLTELPAYSSIYYYDYEGKDFVLTPDIVGKYTIEITEENSGDVLLKEYVVKSNKEYKETEIYAIIEKALSEGELDKLEEGLNKIFENNPYNSKLKDYFEKYMNYLLDKNMKKEAFELYQIINMNYKYSESQGKKILNNIYMKDTKDKNLNIDILKLLSKLDESYKKDLAILELNENIEVENNLKTLIYEYKKTMDKGIAKSLSRYYIENKNFEKAENYLKVADKSLLAIEYLNRNEKDKFEYIVSILSDKEIIKVEEQKKLLEKEKMVKLYFDKARINAKTERYQIADIYYKRVIEQAKDKEQLKEAMIGLAEMYFEENKLEESLLVYNRYLKEFGSVKDAKVRYSLGIIYYNLKKFAESDKIFNQIVFLYPRTVWATRASIYKLKIKNKGESNES